MGMAVHHRGKLNLAIIEKMGLSAKSMYVSHHVETV